MGLHELLERIVVVLERLGVPYLVTGSIASIAYGEPRLTNDIDIVAAVGDKDIPALLEAFPEDTYYLSGDAIREAVRHQTQFNIIHPASGLKIDVIIMRDTAFDKSRLARIRRIHPAPAYEANFAAPEDVIIKKMQYYAEGSSEKHLRDIAGILMTSGEEIDHAYIEHWAAVLELSTIWEAILDRLRD